MNDKTREYIKDLLQTHPEAKSVNRGSSLKFCILAEGSANIYPRFGTTMEWDIAAGHAILKYAGGRITDISTGKELTYNKKDLRNHDFIACSS